MIYELSGPNKEITKIEMDTRELMSILQAVNWGPPIDSCAKIIIKGRHPSSSEHSLTLERYVEDFRGKRPEEKAVQR